MGNGSLNYDPEDPDKMRLPKGTTCGDCGHIKRCKAMFGHVETDAYCDWSPSRFSRRFSRRFSFPGDSKCATTN